MKRLAILATIILGMGFTHPFYVSMTDINYNSSSRSLEIGVRIFTDDLEKTLRKNYPGSKVELMNPTDKKAMEKMIAAYVNRKLQITADDQPVTLQCIGFERVEESIWSYYEAVNQPAPKTVRITNTLLYDYKKEQTNMVHIKTAGKEETRSLVYPNNSLIFRF
jgi:hypothetical protein